MQDLVKKFQQLKGHLAGLAEGGKYELRVQDANETKLGKGKQKKESERQPEVRAQYESKLELEKPRGSFIEPKGRDHRPSQTVIDPSEHKPTPPNDPKRKTTCAWLAGGVFTLELLSKSFWSLNVNYFLRPKALPCEEARWQHFTQYFVRRQA